MRKAAAGVKGGVILFRGGGTAARRYLEADRSQADDYFLQGGTALAAFTISDASGVVVAEAGLDPQRYAGWVDWTHPLTGEQMGTPREPGEGRQGSPRFAEMVVNTPKSLSIAAATVPGSHTILTDALDAAAVYVGMTRGRQRNVLHVVAADLADARQQFIEAMQRDRADRGLTAATQAAKEATRGLTGDGPVKLVNTELARLNREAEQAQRRAERWAQIARQLDARTAEHQDEADDADAVFRAVQEHAATVRVQVVEPLTVQAQADGRDYLAAVADEAEATERLHNAGRFGRRRAQHDRHDAHEHTEALQTRARRVGHRPGQR